MRTVVIVCIFLAMIVVVGTGCRSSGSREFIPGRGWVPNR